MKMIYDWFVNWIIDQGEIQSEDKELYVYAIKSIVLTVSPILLALAIGLVMRCPVRSVLVILPFALIRKFSGGYHAKSAVACLIGSVLLMVGCVLLTYFFETRDWVLILTGISIVGMGIISPVDHANKRLSKQEKQTYKIVAIIMALFFFFTAGIFRITGLKVPCTCICMGILLSAILQYPAILKREDGR